MFAHISATGHKLCGCGGYHYAHRPGSTYCVQHPLSAVFAAARSGDVSDDELHDIELECILQSAGKPFTIWRD